MATTQSEVTDKQALRPYFWLRISGLPYYFFANVTNPSFAPPFVNPVDYPDGWAKGGMIIPDQDVSQRFQDIIGGVASPERMKITLIDFDDPNHPGVGYLSRLFAPGRVLSSLTANVGILASNISAGSSTFLVRGTTNDVVWSPNSVVYVGNEGIGVSQAAVNSDGTTTLTILQRNKYPAMGTAQDATTCFPSAPYHHIGGYDSTGAATEGAWVANDIINVYGRTCALFMGNIGPGGVACTEAEGTCILLGRLTAIDTSNSGVGFDLTIDSITSDLDKALVAPDLAADRIVPGYYLPSGPFCTLAIDAVGTVQTSEQVPTYSANVSIPSGQYSRAGLQIAIGAALRSMGTTSIGGQVAVAPPEINVTLVNGEPRWLIYSRHNFVIHAGIVGSLFPTGPTYLGLVSPVSIAHVLGLGNWTSVQFGSSVPGNGGRADSQITASAPDPTSSNAFIAKYYTIIGSSPVAHTFVPTVSGARFKVPLVTPGSAALFKPTFFPFSLTTLKVLPLIRFGDGKILPTIGPDGAAGAALAALTGASSASTNFLTIAGGVLNDDGSAGYYVSGSQTATVEQVLMDTDEGAPSLARMICSTTGATQDGEFNVYPEGAGLGWNNVVSKDDFRVPIDSSQNRQFIVDSATKFSDFFRPIAREYGLFMLWDPAVSQVRLRRIQQPTAEAAANGRFASSFIFAENNRATVADRTTAKQDRTSLRSSWKITTGWNFATQAFEQRPILVRSLTSVSFFPNDSRQEDIEDKTVLTPGANGNEALSAQNALSAFLGVIEAHAVICQFPWTTWHRTVNKTGLMLAPGTYHQFVDNTVANPFTGAKGITASDGVYVLLGGTSKNYNTGVCSVDLYVLTVTSKRAFAPWSPCALINFQAASNGYNAGTKVLTFKSHYTRLANHNDGIDFEVGDHVRIVSRHNDSGLTYEAKDVIAAKGANGTTVTLTTGIAALSSVVESVMLLDKYHVGSATRKQGGASAVTWQGNGSTRHIDSVTSTQLSKWQ